MQLLRRFPAVLWVADAGGTTAGYREGGAAPLRAELEDALVDERGEKDGAKVGRG